MSEPLVSVIIIFFNEEEFLGEAIESVFSQTYENWELVLADDCSTDRSGEIARSFVRRRPDRIRYERHSTGSNRGSVRTRNMGMRVMSGEYCALLDGDDVWLPEKLERQVKILEARPRVDMVYGKTEYWWDWRPGSVRENRVQPHHIVGDVEMAPPRLLPLFLSGAAAVPCPSSVLVRSSAVREVGGFEEVFTGANGIYEDQAFFVKISLESEIFVSDHCLERYRQHPSSMTAKVAAPAAILAARRHFLEWSARYVRARDIADSELWRALARERWLVGEPSPSPRLAGPARRLRRLRLRLEDAVLPTRLARSLWKRRTTRLGGAFAARSSG